MKKPYLLYVCLGMLAAFALFSCVKEYVGGEVLPTAPGDLTVAEAKEFFASQATLYATRSAGGERPRRGLTPGEFTPRWGEAMASASDRTAALDVPINAEYAFHAFLSDPKRGDAKKYRVGTPQRLVILKNPATDYMTMFMVTLIPSREYYRSRKNAPAGDFVSLGKKGEFTGIAIYSNVEKGFIVRAEAYRDGKFVKLASMSGPRETFPARKAHLESMLSGITFGASTARARTR